MNNEWLNGVAGPYREAVIEAVDGFERPVYDAEAIDGTQRYLLVEASTYDGTLYLTQHDSPVDAAIYHDTQEEPDGWPVESLIDLASGESISFFTDVRYETTFAGFEAVDRSDLTVWRVTAADLDRLAGYELSGDELERITVAIDHSTANESIEAAVAQIAHSKEED
jgi:hypothetical protein